MTTRNKITCGIIGYGKLGSVLADAITKTNRLLWITDNGPIDKKLLFNKFRKKTSINGEIKEIISIPEIIIISVNDSKIKKAAKELSIFLKNNLKDIWVVHCSGVMPVSVLSSCEKFGAKTACIHPYQTFYEAGPSVLKGISWTIETKSNPEFLQSLIKKLKGNPFYLSGISKNKKVFHHLSAVFASNFLSTVLSGAGALEEIAGMQWENFIPPIVETTKRNNFKSLSNSDKIPLTGPIARADVESIKLHINALGNHSNLLNIYIYLSLATLETAKQYRIINKQKFAEIKEILLSSLKD